MTSFKLQFTFWFLKKFRQLIRTIELFIYIQQSYFIHNEFRFMYEYGLNS